MMSLWDALRMNMMISYQELVRTFPNSFFAAVVQAVSGRTKKKSQRKRAGEDFSPIFCD